MNIGKLKMLQLKTMNYEIKTLNSKEFPVLLSEIPDAPKQLYLRGVLPSPQTKLLAVVGSRKYSPYGKDACEKLIKGLSGYDIAIVSGLALGMDSIAHKAALSAKLKTIAVPGSGLDNTVLYPSSHRMLARQILEDDGALLSEFEPSTRAAPYTFPQRNRIMAGMSHAVLVIEATERSGTLITSRLATEYNRDVLTVPGSVFSPNSYGPHMLLRLGATPITKSDDLLEALHIEKTSQSSNSLIDLSKSEREIINLLIEPLSRDELLTQLNMPIQEANVILSAMEIKGIITEKLGKIHSMLLNDLTQ